MNDLFLSFLPEILLQTNVAESMSTRWDDDGVLHGQTTQGTQASDGVQARDERELEARHADRMAKTLPPIVNGGGEAHIDRL